MKKTILFLLMFCLGFVSVLAEENSEKSALFSVETRSAKGQDSSIQSYYEMNVSEGLSTTLPLRIKNHQKKSLKIQVEVNQAITNRYGYIQYTQAYNPEAYYTSPVQIADFLSYPQEVIEIPALSYEDVEIKVDVPKGAVKGNVLAGIYIHEAREKQQEGVGNTYAYVISLMLKDHEGRLQSSEDLKYLGVRFDKLNHRPMLLLQLANPEARVLDDLSLDLRLEKEGETVFHYEQEHLQMAPNTQMDYSIPFEDKNLKGNYQMFIQAKSYENKWVFEDHVSIQMPENEEKASFQNVFSYTIPLFIMLFSLVYLFVLRKKRKETKKHEKIL